MGALLGLDRSCLGALGTASVQLQPDSAMPDCSDLGVSGALGTASVQLQPDSAMPECSDLGVRFFVPLDPSSSRELLGNPKVKCDLLGTQGTLFCTPRS